MDEKSRLGEPLLEARIELEQQHEREEDQNTLKKTARIDNIERGNKKDGAVSYFGIQPTTKISKFVSNKITILQFWGIVAVVYTHSYNGYPRVMLPDKTYSPKNYIIAFEYFLVGGALRFAVPMFFMMSGFLFFMHKKYDQPDFKIGKRIYSRINSVLLPYLFWDAIAYICVVLILLLIPNSQVMWPWQNWLINKNAYELKQIFWTIKDKLISPVPYPLWYLRDLFLLVLHTPIFLLLHKKLGKLWILPFLVFPFWLYDLWPLSFLNLYILDLDGYFFFPIGALLALYNVNIERKISLKWALICYVIPWLSFNIGKVVIATFEDESGPTKLFSLDVKIVLYKLSLPFGVCSIWFLYDHIVEGLESFYAEKKATTIVDGKIVQVPTITTKWFNKMLRAVTPYTLWIYCAHEPVMGYLFEILQPFLGLCKMINVGVTSNSDPNMVQRCQHTANPIWFLLFYIFAPFIWICVLVFLGSRMRKYIPKVFARLTGGRV